MITIPISLYIQWQIYQLVIVGQAGQAGPSAQSHVGMAHKEEKEFVMARAQETAVNREHVRDGLVQASLIRKPTGILQHFFFFSFITNLKTFHQTILLCNWAQPVRIFSF